MARLTPTFSTNRTVREYTDKHYVRLASAYTNRAADAGTAGTNLVIWQQDIASHWHELRFLNHAVERRHSGYFLSIQVELGSLQPRDVRMEIYADPLNSDKPFLEAMPHIPPSSDAQSIHEYVAAVPSDRPSEHYTPRAVPYHPDVSIPLELPLITWQK
jgi:glycogen phosphorylase